MSSSKCQYDFCDEPSTMHFVRAEGTQSVETTHLCGPHGRIHIIENNDRYYSTSRVGPGAPLRLGGGVAFYIDFLFIDELQDPPWGHYYLGLIERGGQRRLGFTIDTYACAAIDFEFQQYKSPRPLTHHAMTAAIAALGGRIEYVAIDQYDPAHSSYHAKLHLQHMNTTHVVDVRPTDAIALALISNVPIIVENNVLRTLAALEHGQNYSRLVID